MTHTVCGSEPHMNHGGSLLVHMGGATQRNRLTSPYRLPIVLSDCSPRFSPHGQEYALDGEECMRETHAPLAEFFMDFQTFTFSSTARARLITQRSSV